jgi:hypothetical protein
VTVYPKGLPEKYQAHWRYPWKARARFSPGFRRWLDKHGFLTPHFTLREAASKDGQGIPTRYNRKARDHAFNMERLRHKLGDVPIPVTSWYRSPAHNRAVGGAANSRHLYADACDIPLSFCQKVGRFRFDKIANEVFSGGGFGQYPGGARHVDSRGFRARWTSWVPGR